MSEVIADHQFEISTEIPGLTLRLPQSSESEALYELVEDNHDYLAEWVPWVTDTYALENSASSITEGIELFHNKSAYRLCMYFKGVMCGAADIRNIEDADRDAEVGYWVANDVAGKGFATAATKALVALARDQLGLSSVILRTKPGNLASNKVALRAGFTLEGQVDDEEGLDNVYRIEFGRPN